MLTGVTMVVTVIFAADFALSFKAALDLRDVLVRMEQAKDELEKMQRRLDVILAVSEENWENRKKEWNQSVESTRAGFVQRRDELVSGIEKRFERAKELLPSGRLNVNREELFDLRSKFGVNLQRPELASFLKDFTKRDMLRGNPGMVSKKFSEALEELKKSAVEYKKREKKVLNPSWKQDFVTIKGFALLHQSGCSQSYPNKFELFLNLYAPTPR